MITLRKCRIVLSFAVFVGGLFLIALMGIRLLEEENLSGNNDIDAKDHFRRIEPDNPDSYVHSAFWDTRQRPQVVRILVLSSIAIDESKTHVCLLDYGDERGIVTTEFKKQTLPENLFFPHSGAFFLCEAEAYDAAMPKAVAIRRRGCEKGAKCEHRLVWKPVKSLNRGADFKDELAVCVRPFFGPFDDTFALAEFIAYYELMGATRFYFFNYQNSPDVLRFIAALQSNPKRNFDIEVNDWNLPEHVLPYEHGQLLSINYCVYHVMSKYKYLAIVDVDEHLVPRDPRHTLLSFVPEHDRDDVGTFAFRNYFFCKSNSSSLGLPKIATHTIRNRLPAFRYRTKVILKPVTVLLEGIHFTYEWIPGFKEHIFKLDVGSLNHYREQFCIHDDEETVHDSYASDYFANRVITSTVLKTWRTFSKKREF